METTSASMALRVGETREVIPVAGRSLKQQLLLGRAIRFAPDGDYWRGSFMTGMAAVRHLLVPTPAAADNESKPRRLAEVEVARVVARSQSQRTSLSSSVIAARTAGGVLACRCSYDLASRSEDQANQLVAGMAREAIFELCGAAHQAKHRIHLQPCENQRVPGVPSSGSSFVQKFDHRELIKAATYIGREPCQTDFGDVLVGKSTCSDQKLPKNDTNAVHWGLLTKGWNFLRLHLSAMAQSLLSCLSNLPTDIRRGPSHLTPLSNLVKGDIQMATNKQILFFCSISFNLLCRGHAQDQTENGKLVDSAEVWQTSDYAQVAAMTLLASSIGGVGVAVWIIYNRRNTFSEDDINEGLMSGPAVVLRSDPNFALHPPIEPWSDEE